MPRNSVDLPAPFGADHRNQRARRNLSAEMMHGRVPVIAEREIVKVQRCHRHLIASKTMPHSTAQTASAAARRPAMVMRRIDQGAAWAGCGEVASWTWAWV
ncbi:hypothetical protein ABIA07_005421 [Bradyrhizobium yuanmingense]